MLDFNEWGKATVLKNRIIDLDNYENVETEINSKIEELRTKGATDKELLDFVENLNMLFLTYLVTEGQDHSKTNKNVKIAREILKRLETELKKK